MNKNLQKTLHGYAEDREIDYTSAKVIGEQNGLTFKKEKDLVEWKQIIDTYLKTFNQSDWDKIENYIAEGSSSQALAQAKAYLKKADPFATITQKGDKYALQYNGKVELYDLENLVKRCIAIGTAVKGDALKQKMPLGEGTDLNFSQLQSQFKAKYPNGFIRKVGSNYALSKDGKTVYTYDYENLLKQLINL